MTFKPTVQVKQSKIPSTRTPRKDYLYLTVFKTLREVETIMKSLRSGLRVLVLLTIKGIATASQNSQSEFVKSTYSTKTITLNFDDLATEPTTGVGPHGSFTYEGIYFQSITVINTTAAAHAKPHLIDIHDKFCATSRPNAIIGGRSPGQGAHVLPRLSLRGLYASQSPSAAEEDFTFNVISLSMAPLGFVPGASLGYSNAEIHVNFFRMPKTASTHSTADLQSTFPGLLPGEPIHDRDLIFSELTGFYTEGRHPSLPVYLREWFGPDFAFGVDVIEIYGEISRLDEAGEWSGMEDWPFCIDDIVLEVVKGKRSSTEISGGQAENVKAREKKICHDDTACYTGELVGKLY